MHHMYGGWDSSWDWLWISLMAILWILVLAAVVYGAVWLALDHQSQGMNGHRLGRRRRP